MDNIVLLFACLAIGMALRASRRAPDNAPAALNAFIIHAALPALILGQVHAVRIEPALAYAAAMPWLVFAASVAVFATLGRLLRLPAATTGALAVVAGLGNTSFIGLPMIETYYGAADMPIGIVVDQLGSYLVLSTLGIVTICLFADVAVTRAEILRRIVTFPPLLALLLAVVLRPIPMPDWTLSALARLGATLAPLALVSVGLQLRLGAMAGRRSALAMGLSYKLALAPLLMLLVYAGAFGLRGEATRVTLFEAGMAPMVGGAIVATQYGLDGPLISLMVGVGTLLSFLTLPLWWGAFAGL